MTVEDAGARPLAGRLSVGPEPGRGRALALRVLGRLARAVITLVGVAVVVFIVLRLLPGNQITSSLGVNAGLLTKAQYTDLEHFYGIGKPLPQQFGQWAGDLLHGNMGVSEQSGRSVTSLIGAALPVTLELAVAAMLIGLVIGVGAGVVAAAAPGWWRWPGGACRASSSAAAWWPCWPRSFTTSRPRRGSRAWGRTRGSTSSKSSGPRSPSGSASAPRSCARREARCWT